MSNQDLYAPKPKMTLREAKKILGINGTGMNDESIKKLILQIDIITDVVVAHTNGSKIKLRIDL